MRAGPRPSYICAKGTEKGEQERFIAACSPFFALAAPIDGCAFAIDPCGQDLFSRLVGRLVGKTCGQYLSSILARKLEAGTILQTGEELDHEPGDVLRIVIGAVRTSFKLETKPA